MISLENIQNPITEIFIFIVMAIMGIFLINYYTLNKEKLYKVAFVTIICFGLCSSVLTPIAIVPDEEEHFSRSVITSTGDFFPEYVEPNGIQTFQLVGDMASNRGITILDSSLSHTPINYTHNYFHSAFLQNPFYGYLAQAFGILIAELLSLPASFTLLLARISNMVLYAVLVAVAVRKTPILKIPMIVFACMPMAIFQASSASIDSLINGLSFIVIAHFFYLLKFNDSSIGKKEVAVAAILVTLLGLCKLPYFAFFVLFILIPRNKFKPNYYMYTIILLFVLLIIAILWNNFYASPNLLNSYRLNYTITNNVSTSLQLDYMQSHLSETFVLFGSLSNYLEQVFLDSFVISYPPYYWTSGLISSIYPLFIGSLIFLYPFKNKPSKKLRIGVFLVVALIFISIYLIQLLSWTTVGSLSQILGVQFRYFIPIFILLPFIFNFSLDYSSNDNMDNLIMVITFGFAAALILSLIRFY